MDGMLLLAVNLTRRCNLACAHCYLDAGTLNGHGDNELTTDEVCRLLDDVAADGERPMVVLTGGEPLIRRDLEDIVAHGAQLGLAMVVGTNGMMLTERRVASLQRAGLLGAGISVDSLDADKHDKFRGRPGAWQKTMSGIEQCRRQGLSFQIHFSVTDDNADELAGVIDFASSTGARVLNVFFLVCTGRGTTFTDITAARYEDVLVKLIEAQKSSRDLIIRPRCAPHFKRVAFQRDPDSILNRIGGNDGDGCIAGTRYCRVKPEGGVTACPYIDDEVGNIRDDSLTDLWRSAESFSRLRHPQLKGTCGQCEFQKLCGGCRARPVAAGNDLMDADAFCTYTPRGPAIIEPLAETAGFGVRWTAGAETRLSRIPPFLRAMVKKRAEAYVAELGETAITTAHLEVLSARRFGRNMPRRSDA